MENGVSSTVLARELDKASQFRLVDKAYTTLNSELVVIKLRVDPSRGLYSENFLFYPADEFAASNVTSSIDKIIGENL